jgi:5-methylcytosine-specific restriction endonuclease McrA
LSAENGKNLIVIDYADVLFQHVRVIAKTNGVQLVSLERVLFNVASKYGSKPACMTKPVAKPPAPTKELGQIVNFLPHENDYTDWNWYYVMGGQMQMFDGKEGRLRRDKGMRAAAAKVAPLLAEARKIAIEIGLKQPHVDANDVRKEMMYRNRPYDELGNGAGSIFLGNHWKEVGRKRSDWADSHARNIATWMLEDPENAKNIELLRLRPYDEYQAHLGSIKWRGITEKIHTRAHGVCERCFVNPSTHIHHLTYENLGNERWHELMALCVECHQFVHGHANTDPLRETKLFLSGIPEEFRRVFEKKATLCYDVSEADVVFVYVSEDLPLLDTKGKPYLACYGSKKNVESRQINNSRRSVVNSDPAKGFDFLCNPGKKTALLYGANRDEVLPSGNEPSPFFLA